MLFQRSFSLLCLVCVAAGKWIVPAARWVDTDGNPFNAHAGGMYVDEKAGKFYWFGEYKTTEKPEGNGFSVYSSDDLATWTYHGIALKPEEGHPWIDPHNNRMQRPKVMYSEETSQYHLWWHADDNVYSELVQGLATADEITGPYTFQKVVSPLGNWSQDLGAFTDYKDGRSYALYSNGDSVEGRDVYVTRFNRNLTDLENEVYRFPKFDLEAPTIIQTERFYYALMSHKTGYRPNIKCSGIQVEVSFWALVYAIYGFSSLYTYLYMGDTWDMNGHSESRNTWLPMKIDDNKGRLEVEWHDVYDLNMKTGEWHPIKGKTYWAKDAKTIGGAYKQEASFAGSGVMITGIKGNDSKTIFEVEGYGKDQWVSFYHQNIDDMGFGDQPYGQPDRINGTWQLRRISSVIVNGDEDDVHTLYQKDTHKGIILSSPLKLFLKKGKNKLTIGGLNNGKDDLGADLEKIVVYPPEGSKNHWF